MPSTTPFDFGDILLLTFPFTDTPGSKQRPAVVVSRGGFNETRHDLVMMPVTSRIQFAGTGSIFVTHWQESGLLKPSVIKPIFFTLEKRLVRRQLGTLLTADKDSLRSNLRAILG